MTIGCPGVANSIGWTKCWQMTEADIARIEWPRRRRVHTEKVPWARPAAGPPATSERWWRGWPAHPQDHDHPPRPGDGGQGRPSVTKRVRRGLAP